MRNPAKSIQRVPGHLTVAKDVKTTLQSFLCSHPEVRDSILKTIGRSKEEMLAQDLIDLLTEEHLGYLRLEIALA